MVYHVKYLTRMDIILSLTEDTSSQWEGVEGNPMESKVPYLTLPYLTLPQTILASLKLCLPSLPYPPLKNVSMTAWARWGGDSLVQTPKPETDLLRFLWLCASTPLPLLSLNIPSDNGYDTRRIKVSLLRSFAKG